MQSGIYRDSRDMSFWLVDSDGQGIYIRALLLSLDKRRLEPTGSWHLLPTVDTRGLPGQTKLEWWAGSEASGLTALELRVKELEREVAGLRETTARDY